MSLFRDLYAIVRHTPLTLIITPRGEQLSVVILPKPSGDVEDNPALRAPISAVGTPEELDAQLPEAVRTYAGKIEQLRVALDLPLDAIEKATTASAHKPRTPPKPAPAAKTKAPRAAKPTKDKPPTAKPRKAAQANKAKAAAQPPATAPTPAAAAPDPAPPATTPQPAPVDLKWPFPTQTNAEFLASAGEPAPPAVAAKGKPRRTPEAAPARPGKAECIADYRALYAEWGAQLTRRRFVATAPTGRRYEKLWKNWEAFEAEARPHRDDDNLPLPLDPQTIAGESQDPAQPGEPLATPAAEPAPYVDGPPLGSPDAPGWDVFDHTGAYLSSITTEPHLGRQVFLTGHAHGLIVVKIEGKRVTVFAEPATATA